jgi:DNA-binding transcriptional regulator YiaG
MIMKPIGRMHCIGMAMKSMYHRDMSSDSVSDLLELHDLIASGRARKLREGADLSATAMARDLDVNPSQVIRWERGERYPRGANARRYARMLRRLAEWEAARQGAAS